MPVIGILGASGYAGAELVRIALGHPETTGLRLSSVSFEGKDLGDIYPSFRGLRAGAGMSAGGGLPLESAEAVIAGSDVIFSCLPHGHAEAIAPRCLTEGKLLIDLSADFRFGDDEATFKRWYGLGYAHPDVHASAVYGLPELNRAAIRGARIIGNPGCYPTSAALGLYPALKNGLADTSMLVIDSASGVTGAGREPSQTTHYPECADSLAPYKVGAHRHQPEIDRTLSLMAGRPVRSVFTPHLAPMNRGIVSTIYFGAADSLLAGGAVDAKALRAAYREAYADEPFVRVLPEGAVASNRGVKHSNFCDISVHSGADGKTAIVVASIDNMVKGAAGQAVQNMNIALGYPETAGLGLASPSF